MRLPNRYPVEVGPIRYYCPWHFLASGMVNCGFGTRTGGASEAPYESLNLSLAVGDDSENVVVDRRAFADALAMDAERLVVPDQVHSNTVRRVTEQDAGRGALDHSTAIPDTDALVTNVPDLPLALHFADCVCVFFLDPVNRAVGVAHAGWRGTAEGIVTSTVAAMTHEFGSEPSELLAAIGPSIERHCYEVGEDVAKSFFLAFPDNHRILSPSSNGKWRCDLRAANLVLLRRAGLDDSNIGVSERCTSCNIDEFFSYRRDGLTGRMGGWLSLRG